MSTVDPISPTSPTSPTSSSSPISPMERTELLKDPVTPILGPSTLLPRLVTSFQNTTSNSDNVRGMTIQFQLPTPSPLSLGQTPLFPAQSQDPAQWKIWYTCDKHGRVERTILNSSSTCSGRPPPEEENITLQSAISRKHPPSLLRQNANEGLDELLLHSEGFMREWMTQQPLRLSNSKSSSAGRDSSTIDTASTEAYDLAALQPTSDGVLVPRPRSRSPISKRKTSARTSNHRRRLTRPDTSGVASVIRQPQSPRTKQCCAEFSHIIAHLSHRLVPLVSVTNGLPHPEFPLSLLQFQLLTHDQLDDLARWYHQSCDAGRERWMYPCPIEEGKTWCRSLSEKQAATHSCKGFSFHLVDLETKRRRWGRFIGLRGCESPAVEIEEEDLEQRMERDWREAMRRARDAELLREKMWRGHL